MACLSAMLFFGCGRAAADFSPSPGVFSTSPALSASPAAPLPSPAAAAPTAPPSISPAPAATEHADPTPTPFAINAVYGFYGQFQSECGALLDDYAAGLSNRNSAEGLTYSLLLSEHRAYLSEGRITAGRLQGSDGDGYSGTLEAAASGTGRMRGSPENGYVFSFSYTDGRTLSGSFAESTLEFTLFSADGGASLFCRMQKAGDVWFSSAATTKYQTELTVRLSPESGGAPVQFAKRSGDFLPATKSIAEQEGE